MKKRNPLVVAGFPYAAYFVGYTVATTGSSFGRNDTTGLSSGGVIAILVGLSIIIVGAFYYLYWLISTGRELKRRYPDILPSVWLTLIPFVAIWWLWKYSAAVELFTKEKVQRALAFILLLLLYSIGAGILQDFYNKVEPTPAEAVPHA